ncbi:MAG: NUDIX domain-containing protein [Glutamicibacter sp.]|nr:NUDIX domain-containing protein [Arthrobacter sp. JUb115]
MFPGGKPEPDGPPIDAAVREVSEELRTTPCLVMYLAG